MRIYQFEYPRNERDWVFAPTMKEAKEFYISFTECGDLNNVKVSVVPKKEWCNHYILDINESEPESDEDYNEDDYSCGYKILNTFAEYADLNDSIDLIATTEF